jgi:hypothetical protein
MAVWTKDELDTIDEAEELTFASSRRRHAAEPRDDVVVRDGDDVYVRSVNGRGSSWFRGAQARHKARIRAGGVEKDVSLIETGAANEAIDAAYHAKYDRRYPSIVPRIVAPDARAATLKLVPR